MTKLIAAVIGWTWALAWTLAGLPITWWLWLGSWGLILALFMTHIYMEEQANQKTGQELQRMFGSLNPPNHHRLKLPRRTARR